MKHLKLITLVIAFLLSGIVANSQTYPCGIPTGLKNSSITQTTAVISWNKVSGASYYGVYYGTTSVGMTYLTAKDTLLALSGLTAGTNYYWKVETFCLVPGSNTYVESGYSQYFSLVTLATPPPTCPVATEFSSTNITQTTASLAWSKVTGSCGFTVMYYPTNAPTSYKTITASSNSTNLTGLTPATAYQWKVKTICCPPAGSTVNTYSEYSTAQTFTTLSPPPCNPPTNLNFNSLTSTSVVLTWDVVTNAYAYILEYWDTSTINNHFTTTVTTNSASITGLRPGIYYFWKVKTYCGNGITGDFSSTANFTTLQTPPACNAPATLTTKEITQTGAIFSWSTVDGACSYKGVYYPLNTTTVSYPFTTTATSFSVTNLKPATSYRWIVQTICCTGNTSTNYTAQNFVTLSPPPSCTAPITLVNSKLTSTSITISWNKPATACYFNIKYFVYGTKDTITKTTQDSSLNLTGLIPGTYYHWRVQTICCNQIGLSPWSHDQIFTTPALVCNAPSSSSTTGITQTGATFTWSKVDGACSYKGTYFQVNNTSSVKTFATTYTSFIVDGLQANTSYIWKVQTVCCTGNTSTNYTGQNFTTLPTTACNAPITAKVINITQTSATLTWSKVDGACSYNYYITPYNGKLTNTTETSVTLTDLKPGTGYYWMVQTVCCSGSTSSSYTQQFSTLAASSCNAPATSETSHITQTGATFTWSAVEGACGYTGSYFIVNNSTSHKTFTTTYTSFTVDGLQANTSYRWLVQTVCCTGNTSTNYIAQNFTTLPTIPCNAPAYIKIKEITQTSVKLVWNKVEGACSYTLSYNIPGVTNFITVVTQDTTILIEKLLPNTSYHLYIHTICCNNIQSTTFADIMFTTLSPPNSCLAPAKLYPPTNVTQTTATLSWSKVIGACSFTVVYYPANTPTSYKYFNTKDTTAKVDGLLANTDYQWKIMTICCPPAGSTTNSYSGYSEIKTFKTVNPPVCNAPTVFKSENLTPVSITLKWNKVSGACGYNVTYFVYTNTSLTKTITVKDTILKLEGLTPGTYYHWQVQTICCNNGSSEYGHYQIFTTPQLPACNPPRVVKTIHITQTSATLTWSKVDGACSYNYYITPYNGKLNNIKDTSVIVTGLTAGTNYTWIVQTVCCSGGTSTTYTTQTFTTLPIATCNPPKTYKTTNISQTGGTVSWSKVEGACGYYLLYYTTSNTALKTINTKDTSFVISGLLPGTEVHWMVNTVCCNSNQGQNGPLQVFVTLQIPPVDCKAPLNLKVKEITQTSAIMTWSKVNTAYSYLVSYWPAGSPSSLINVTVKDTTTKISGLLPNTKYVWEVKTYCTATGTVVSSDWSPLFDFITLPVPPQTCNAPTHFNTKNITQNSAVISWNKVPNVCNYYIIYYPANNTATYIVLQVKDTTAILPNLLAGVEYQWKVRTICCTSAGTAYNYSDFGAIQTFKTIVPPPISCPMPIYLKAADITSYNATITWDIIPGAVSYIVAYWQSGNAATPITVNVLTNKLILSGLLPYKKYEWKVKAVCSTNPGTSELTSDWSLVSGFITLPVATPVCKIPQGLVTTAITPTSAKLNWHKVEKSCGYIVVWFTSNTSVYKTLQTTDTTLVIDGLQPDTYYIWKVQTICCDASINWKAVSDFSPVVYFKTLGVPVIPCTPPKEFKTSEISQYSAVISWNAVEGACGYYIIYYPYKDSLSYKIINTKEPNTILAGLLPNTYYQWKVKTMCCSSTNANFNYSDFGPLQSFKTLPVQQILCKIPAEPASSDITQTTAVVKWNKVENACSYTLIYYPLNNTTAYIVVQTKENIITLKNLLPNTEYQWKVKTICCVSGTTQQGESDFTPLQSFKTLAAPQPDCKAPVELSSSDITQTSAVLSWNPVTNANTYLVEYWQAGNANTPSFVKTQDTLIKLNGLLAGTKYEWEVKTYCNTNATGTMISSDWSMVVNFTTLPMSPNNCMAPKLLVNERITTNTALLKWNKVPGATTYVVEYYPNNALPVIIMANTKDTAIAIGNLQPNTVYVWKVRTICCGPTSTTPCFESEFSLPKDFKTLPIVETKCLAPKNPVAVNITQNSATLKWIHADNACYYEVYYTSEITTQPGYLIIRSKDTSVTLTNLISNMKYDWKVRTICCAPTGTASESDFTALQVFSTLNPEPAKCNAPTELASANITQTSATLKWLPANNACYYLIVYNPIGSSTDMIKYVKSTVPYINIAGLLPNTKYEWKVKSYCCNASGSVLGESDFSAVQTFITLQGQEQICNVPKHTITTEIGQTSTILRWDSVPHACLYLVALYPANSSTPVIKYIKTLDNYLKVEGLLANSYYSWKVKTYCCNPTSSWMAESEFSPLMTFKTLPTTEIKCQAPKNLKTTNILAFSAILKWSAEKNAVGYLVNLWSDTLNVRMFTTKDTIFPVQSLKTATVYHWKVKSICYSSTSNMSDFGPVQTFTTLAIPEVPCNPPTDIVSGDVGAHKATIGWTPNAHAQYYLVYYKPRNSTVTFKYATTTNPKYLLSGLIASTEYAWKVKSICSLSSINAYKFSSFSPEAYFKTLADTLQDKCKPPMNLVASDITDNSAILGWTTVNYAKVYAIAYNEANSTELKYKTTALPILPLMDLKPLTKYLWRVAALCNFTPVYAFSQFSDTTSFVTNVKAGKNISKSNITDVDITVYPNPTDGMIKINIINSTSQTKLIIYDIAGQKVYIEDVNASASVTKEVDMSVYPKGIYFIKATNDNSIVTKKIIVH